MDKKDKDKGKLDWTKFVGKEVKIIFSFGVAAAVLCVIIALLAMFGAPGGADTIYRPCGRIVITSDSKGPDGFVSSTFERSRYFITYDLATKRFSTTANPYFNEMNPGAKAARFIANKSEEAVISGNIGPAACQTLENFNISVYLVHKTSVRDAIRLFLEGNLIHIKSQSAFGTANLTPQMPLQARAVAWGGGFAQQGRGPACPRTAYCPQCGLTMPLGAHIQANRIMCPYCPGQIMQIMAPLNNQMGLPAAGQGQRVGFGPGIGPGLGFGSGSRPASRGVCILR